MRRKRARTRLATEPGDDHPPDATGLTIDGIGTQETGGGGATFPWFVVVALVALRALPFLARKAAQRLRERARPTLSSGSGAEPGRGETAPRA